jgi:pimeloyl-ACP methyl ester carboxylesterase
LSARDCWHVTFDGLRLFYRDHDDAGDGKVPVVCLPGLSRNHRDFGPLEAHLAPRRRVICPDMRGRGRSDRASDPAQYTVGVEVADILHLLDALEVTRAVFIGTSRGGLQTMVIAQVRPGLVAGAALNDIGPRIESEGLARIVATLNGAPERFESWADATDAVRRANVTQFPDLTDAQWDAFARRIYRDENGRPARDYDPALATASAEAFARPLPEIWDVFERLRPVPALAIRGALSDLLSAATLARMVEVKPDLATVTVPARGHVPFLDEPGALAAIDALLEVVDG